MDEKSDLIEFSKTEVENEGIIKEPDIILRQFPFGHFPKEADKIKRRFPNDSSFTPDTDGLSCNWNKYCHAEDSLTLVGLSLNRKGEFLKPNNFLVFRFHIKDLLEIKTLEGKGIELITHDPKFTKQPPTRGIPNNNSHSLIKFENDPELRLKLSDLVGSNYEALKCNVDFQRVDRLVSKYKKEFWDE